ncbi:MAG: hypothetical protein K2Q26_12280 [Bdellovibrionales bacterium]|nr:hypothetical protein [Bdellovibrionales bacterium]
MKFEKDSSKILRSWIAKNEKEPGFRPSLDEIAQYQQTLKSEIVDWGLADRRRIEKIRRSGKRVPKSFPLDPPKKLNRRNSEKHETHIVGVHYDEDGRPSVEIRIDMGPQYSKRGATYEKIKWYLDRENTLEEAAQFIGCSLKRVKKVFELGASSAAEAKYYERPEPLPYGWMRERGRPIKKSTEQWVLAKMAEDMDAGISVEDIAENFNKLGLKPPANSDAWSTDLIMDCIKKNIEIEKMSQSKEL